MNKLLICLLLLSTPVWAAWKSVAEDSAGVTYADSATVVKNGHTATLWSMLDYKSFQRMVEVGYFSQKAQVEYDCDKRQARGLKLMLHAEHMGEGKVVYSDESAHEWEPVAPDSVEETLWKIACQ